MSDSVDTLKQRVVGAFVIISLAVIFLPMIFDEPHQQPSNLIEPVPPRPAFKVVEIEKPVKPKFQALQHDPETNKVIAKDAMASSEEETLAEVQPEPQTPTKEISKQNVSTPSVRHLPVFKNVWMVQLGTFSKTDNAYQLRDKLRLDGFDGHTKKIDLNGTTATRVFTGPFVDKAEAQKIKIKLDKKYKVDSRVIFFDA